MNSDATAEGRAAGLALGREGPVWLGGRLFLAKLASDYLSQIVLKPLGGLRSIGCFDLHLLVWLGWKKKDCLPLLDLSPRHRYCKY